VSLAPRAPGRGCARFTRASRGQTQLAWCSGTC
jgi:hypothetical protein